MRFLPEMRKNVYFGVRSFGNRESSLQGHAQQSVQPTGGTLRRFRASFWLRVFSAPKQNPRPPTRR